MVFMGETSQYFIKVIELAGAESMYESFCIFSICNWLYVDIMDNVDIVLRQLNFILMQTTDYMNTFYHCKLYTTYIHTY